MAEYAFANMDINYIVTAIYAGDWDTVLGADALDLYAYYSSEMPTLRHYPQFTTMMTIAERTGTQYMLLERLTENATTDEHALYDLWIAERLSANAAAWARDGDFYDEEWSPQLINEVAGYGMRHSYLAMKKIWPEHLPGNAVLSIGGLHDLYDHDEGYYGSLEEILTVNQVDTAEYLLRRDEEGRRLITDDGLLDARGILEVRSVEMLEVLNTHGIITPEFARILAERSPLHIVREWISTKAEEEGMINDVKLMSIE